MTYPMPPTNEGHPASLRDLYQLEDVTDDDLPAAIATWGGRWVSIAKTILEFGEDELVENLCTEQAVAVTLLTRALRLAGQ